MLFASLISVRIIALDSRPVLSKNLVDSRSLYEFLEEVCVFARYARNSEENLSPQ
jgi:hypothetical protein